MRTADDACAALLLAELIPALGCTEPVAVALAAAKAREALGAPPGRVTLRVSGNIYKNARAVTIPHSGGRHGIALAAALGVVAGRADAGLECLAGVTDADVSAALDLLAREAVRVGLAPERDGLYVEAVACGADHEARAVLVDDHSRFASVTRDGTPWPAAGAGAGIGAAGSGSSADGARRTDDAPRTDETRRTGDDRRTDETRRTDADPAPATVSPGEAVAFARRVDLAARPELVAALERQIELNDRIAEEGLSHPYGAQVGRTIAGGGAPGPRTSARARAAAASDARMGGCDLPVVINAGSGNQGVTVSLPVVEYARALGSTHEELLRALVVANLLSVVQKRGIGTLSAFCGASSASAGAAAGVALLKGLPDRAVLEVFATSVATTGGLVCDGAKASCAAKIAVALEGALAAVDLVEAGHGFEAGAGLVGDCPEETIEHVGRLGSRGLGEADRVLVELMREMDEAAGVGRAAGQGADPARACDEARDQAR